MDDASSQSPDLFDLYMDPTWDIPTNDPLSASVYTGIAYPLPDAVVDFLSLDSFDCGFPYSDPMETVFISNTCNIDAESCTPPLSVTTLSPDSFSISGSSLGSPTSSEGQNLQLPTGSESSGGSTNPGSRCGSRESSPNGPGKGYGSTSKPRITCTECNKLIFRKNRNQHMRTHETNRPMFKCYYDDCRSHKGFTRKDDLRRHLRMTHGDSDADAIYMARRSDLKRVRKARSFCEACRKKGSKHASGACGCGYHDGSPLLG